MFPLGNRRVKGLATPNYICFPMQIQSFIYSLFVLYSMIVNPSIKYKEQNPVYHFTDQFVNLIFL